MERRSWSLPRLAMRACVAGVVWAGLGAMPGYSQDKVVLMPDQLQVQVAQPAAAQPAAQPAQPAPVKTVPVNTTEVTAMTLDQAIQLGYEKQPALAAARASYAAAVSGQRALNNMFLPRLITPDYRIREQQACLGVTIAHAGIAQAEWETRYAVTRNYFSVLYVRQQGAVLDGVLAKLTKARKRADQLVNSGEAVKVTKLDLQYIDISMEQLQAKQAEVKAGEQKALGAIREAIGVGPDYPIVLADAPLPEPGKTLNKDELIAVGLAQRSEMLQANTANQVCYLETVAQGKGLFGGYQRRTFAAAADLHAKQIPQGVSNGVYKPGAIPPEMPTVLIGRKNDRVDRAMQFFSHSSAVVDKTHNLIALEIDYAYQNWQEASEKAARYASLVKKATEFTTKVEERFNEGNATGDEYLRAATLVDQVKAQYNEAVYQHALALATIERATAGGFLIFPPLPSTPTEVIVPEKK
jgi:outer membrane protein TolC